jgi:hypothetical protein
MKAATGNKARIDTGCEEQINPSQNMTSTGACIT